MANSLGSLSEFQIDPNQNPSEIVGMAHATGYEGGNRPPKALAGMASAPNTAPPPKKLFTGVGHGARLQAEWDARLAERPAGLSIPELLADTEKALANYEKHHTKRDCTELEKQLRSELFAPLFGFHVQAEIGRACEILQTLYAKRWSARAYLRDGAWRFATVTEARKCEARLRQAQGADFLLVAKELLEVCKLSLSEPCLLRTEEG
jgi:hypothetical protein